MDNPIIQYIITLAVLMYITGLICMVINWFRASKQKTGFFDYINNETSNFTIFSHGYQ
jgi:type IV secretory pathway component VirB8